MKWLQHNVPFTGRLSGGQETLFKKKSAQAKNTKPLDSYVANTGSELSNEFIEDLYQKNFNKLNSIFFRKRRSI